MRRALIVLACSLIAYVVLVWLIYLLPGVDVLQPAAQYWTGGFFIGAVFSAWASVDAVLDFQDVQRKKKRRLLYLGSRWRVRSDITDFLTVLCMATVGFMVMLRVGSSELMVFILIFGGWLMVIRRFNDRLERSQIEQFLEEENDPIQR